jgi:hypothetical protein
MDPFGIGGGANGASGVGVAAPQPPPPPTEDPYPQAKRAAEDLLSVASDLQADAFSGRGGAQALSAWRAAVRELDAHVASLEAAARACVADPPRFGLTAAAAYLRESEVAGLRYAADDLRRAADQMSASSPSSAAMTDVELGGMNGGFGGGGGGGGRGAAATAATLQPQQRQRPTTVTFAPTPPGLARREEGKGAAGGGGSGGDLESGGGLGGLALGAQQHQQQLVARQDAALDEISQRAESVRRIGLAMHEELESQVRALDELGGEVDETQLQLKSLRKRAADVLRRAGSDRQLCTIAFLVVVLVVLVVLAIA